MSNRVVNLETELSETRRKLTRAEKKLNRSRRHKESAESYNYDLRKKVSDHNQIKVFVRDIPPVFWMGRLLPRSAA